MKIDILSLFPQITDTIKDYSVIGRALEENLVQINSINIRDYSKDKHKKVDDYSYGGGPGMLMTPQPLDDALMAHKTEESHIVYLSPRGTIFDQTKAKDFAKKSHIILLCGHYEGIDQRIIDMHVDEEISLGDFIVTGGELPAMVIVDSIVRLLPDALGNDQSAEIESFNNNLLEYNQYTRPAEYKGLKVPDILLSGNHKEIDQARLKNSIEITKEKRPDLYIKYKSDQEGGQ